jgi:flagellar hook-length control protein FliK
VKNLGASEFQVTPLTSTSFQNQSDRSSSPFSGTDRLDSTLITGTNNRALDTGIAGYLNTMRMADDKPSVSDIGRPLFHLQESIGHSAWGRQLAEIVSISVRGNLQEAEVLVEPKSLGPIQLRLSLEGSTATVAFGAASLETRNAIEANLQILRETLAASGISLNSATVSAETQSQQRGTDRARRDVQSPRATEDVTAGDAKAVSTSRLIVDRLVDTFA